MPTDHTDISAKTHHNDSTPSTSPPRSVSENQVKSDKDLRRVAAERFLAFSGNPHLVFSKRFRKSLEQFGLILGHAPRDHWDFCPDCGCEVNEPHRNECDVERCSVCGTQRVSCGGCKGHDHRKSAWTREWPESRTRIDALACERSREARLRGSKGGQEFP